MTEESRGQESVSPDEPAEGGRETIEREEERLSGTEGIEPIEQGGRGPRGETEAGISTDPAGGDQPPT